MKNTREIGWNAIAIGILALSMAALLLAGCGRPRVEPPRGLFKFSGGDTGIDAITIWLVAIGILGIGVSIAISSFVGKTIAGAGVSGFGAILACALLVKAAIPFLPWVSLGLIVTGGSFLIWYLRRYARATDLAVAFGGVVSPAEAHEDAASQKFRHAALQAEAAACGVKSLIDKSVQKLKTPSLTKEK